MYIHVIADDLFFAAALLTMMRIYCAVPRSEYRRNAATAIITYIILMGQAVFSLLFHVRVMHI